MTYLINKGLDSEESFTIMERVRKGTVAKGKCKEWPDFKKDMIDHDVPDWYIWFLREDQIYVPESPCGCICHDGISELLIVKLIIRWHIMAAYFGIRANAFSYEIMCQGKEKLQYYINDYTRRSFLAYE